MNRNSERIPRRFCLTAVVLPVGSASAARAAGLASKIEMDKIPYQEDSQQVLPEGSASRPAGSFNICQEEHILLSNGRVAAE